MSQNEQEGKYFKMVASKFVPMTAEEIATPLVQKVTGLSADQLPEKPTLRKSQIIVGRRGHANGMGRTG